MISDFKKGHDLSIHYSNTNVASAIDNAAVEDNRGLLVTTSDSGATPDVPNPNDSGLAKLTRYIWRRISDNGITLYYWDTTVSDDPTYLKWRALAGVEQVISSNSRFISSVESGLRETEGNADGEVVFVKAYYDNFHDNGLGGGFFRWSASATYADDNGGIIKPTATVGAGRWIRLNDRFLTPQMWGAKGLGYDPSHGSFFDDTAAFQGASNFAHNLTGAYYGQMATIFIPRTPYGLAKYAITSRIKLNTHLTLLGDGAMTTIQQYGEDHGIVTLGYEKFLNGTHYPEWWDHNVAFNGFSIRGTVDEFGFSKQNGKCGIGVFQPGETSRIDNVGANYFDYGIHSVGAPAPALQGKNITVHGNATAAICFEGYTYGGTYQGYITDLFLDNVSCDIRNNLNPNACMILFRRAVPQGYINGIKFEGKAVRGVVRIEYSTNDVSWLGIPSYNLGYLELNAVNVDGNASYAYVDTNDVEGYLKGNAIVVHTLHPDTPSWPTNQNINLASVRIRNGNFYAVTSVFRDEINPDSDGFAYRIPHRLYQAGVSGLTQAHWLDIDYRAYRALANSTTGYHRVIRRTNLGNKRITTPRIQTSGWYRIATNGSGNYNMATRLVLKDSSSCLDFSVNASLSGTPRITIHENSISSTGITATPFKAIRCGYYRTDNNIYITHWNGAYVDVYIDANNVSSAYTESQVGQIILITAEFPQQLHEEAFLCGPFLISDFDSLYSNGFVQVDCSQFVRGGEVLPNPEYNKDFLTWGTKRLWFDTNNNLRIFDGGYDVIPIVAGSGNGVKFDGYGTRSGAIDGIQVLWNSQGNSYNANTALKVVSREYGIGNGAILTPTITGGAITNVAITNAGNSYNQNPASSISGRKILVEKVMPYGESITCARKIDPNRQVTVKFTQNSKYAEWVSGTTFDALLAAGDVIRYSGTNHIIVKVWSTTLVELGAMFSAASVASAVCDVVGFGLVPTESSYSVLPMRVVAVSTGTTNWSGTFTTVKIRSTSGTEIAEIASSSLASPASLTDGGEITITNKGGMGDEFLSQGIDVRIFNGSTETKLTAGSPIRIMVEGIKYKGQFIY